MGKINKYKYVLASLLIMMIGVSIFPLTPFSFATESTTKTVTIDNFLSERFSSSSTKSVVKNVSSYVPDGYQVKNYEVIKTASDGNGGLKEVNQGRYGGSIFNNVISIPSFNGVEVEVTNTGYTSEMYFGVVRSHNGKQWQITSGRTGIIYTVSPPIGDQCWSGGIAVCPGKLNKDINGKNLPSDIKDGNGWGVMISDGFNGPTKYYYGTEEATILQLKPSSVKIKGAITNNPLYVKVSFSVSDNVADLTSYVNMSSENYNGYDDEDYGTAYGTVYKYNVSTRTNWSAKTYLYEAKIVLNLEPTPTIGTPVLDCSCSADPSAIEFANADVNVTSTLTATLKEKGMRTVKNWTLYGRGNDNSQLQTISNYGYGQTTVNYNFNFTISKDKLAAADTYTETWVMRARVTFTDGTTAESSIECITTVSKDGAEAPPSPSPTEPPKPEYEPPEADIYWSPEDIIVGRKSSLLNKSTHYDDWTWEFADNLAPYIEDTSKRTYKDITFTEPGLYRVTITVTDDEGGSATDSATLRVIASDPVALITGPKSMIIGRPMDMSQFHILNSYTPLEDEGVKLDWDRSEYRYKKIGATSYIDGWPATAPNALGEYQLEARVYDSTGRVSEWGTHIFEVIPDQPPTVEISAPEESYRLAPTTVYISAQSPDGDDITKLLLESRYDDNNDGSFEDEPWTTVYNGAYKESHSVTYTSVGKRQYRAAVTEDYGLTGTSNLAVTDVNNYAPTVDFDAYGLTTQPTEDNGVPEVKYEPGSIYHSWTVATPFSSEASNKAYWNYNNNEVFLKKINYLTFTNRYPDLGLGPNGQLPNHVASDLKAMPSWEIPNNGSMDIFAGHIGVYKASTVGNTETYNVVNALNGTVLNAITFSPTNSYFGKMGTNDEKGYLYFYERKLTERVWTIYTNGLNGDLVNQFDVKPSQDSEIKRRGAVPQRSYVSKDGKYMYVIYENNTYYKDNDSPDPDDYIFDLRLMKFDLTNGNVYWDVEVGPSGDEDIDTFDTAIIEGSEGIYFTYSLADTGGNSSYGYINMYAGFVKNNGAADYISIGTGDEMSEPVLTSDEGMLVFNALRNSKAYGFQIMVRCKTDMSKCYQEQLGKNEDNIYGTPPTPVRLLNSDYFYTGCKEELDFCSIISARDGTTLLNNGGDDDDFDAVRNDVLGEQYVTTDGKVMTFNLGSYDSTNNTVTIEVNQFTFDRENDTFRNRITYYSSAVPSQYINPDSTLDNSINRAVVTADGSIYLYVSIKGGRFIMPLVSASGGGYPKPIDSSTAESNNAHWTTMLYDQYNKAKNFKFDTNIRIDDPNAKKDIGIAAMIQDTKNMYAVEWSANNVLSLNKVVAGTKTVLKSATLTRSSGVTYSLSIKAVNGTITVFVNNSAKLTAADSTFTSGAVGILSFGQQLVAFSGVFLTNYGDAYIEKTYGTALVGEQIEYEKMFKDIESDPKNAEQWTYAHDPNYFANPEGLSAVHGQTYAAAKTTLDKPGLYSITYKAEDNPGLPAYRKWCEPVTKELLVHRRPIARPDVRFTGKIYAEGEALDYTTYDASYDPDVPDYLAERSFRTRWADESAWTAGQRLLYNRPGVELIVQEQVKDIHGAWSYWQETRLYKDGLPPVNQTKPVMTITTPNGSATAPTVYLSEPAIYWWYADAEGDPQKMFRLKLTYIDNGSTILNVEYPGSETSFILQEGSIDIGRKVRVEGQVYSNGLWSNISNLVYFILNTPPSTKLLSFNGPKASEPVYTNGNRPQLQVQVTDAENHPARYIDYEAFFNPAGTLVADTNTATGATAYTTLMLQEGLHNWRARAHDGYQWGGYSENGYFFVDTVRPDDTGEKLDVKPASVTVMLNPFSDAAPSSGHASRALYMQQVNDDGSLTDIDLNGNGKPEYNAPLANQARSYTVGGLKPGQEYRVMVADWDIAGNMGRYEYIYFNTNRPPTANFDWSPKPVYEGDTVTLMSDAADPDGDPLQVEYELISPSGEKQTYSYTINDPYPVVGPKLRLSETGAWQAAMTVSDGIAEEATVRKTIDVRGLAVSGAVKHTGLWDRYRKQYNKSQSGDENVPRAYDTFWAGEKFLLEADTTLTGTATEAAAVTVRMDGGYQTELKKDGTASWSGELWDEAFDSLKEGQLTFAFTVYYTNGMVKRHDVTVRIAGTAEEILGVHRVS